ncbi:hypothetical protein AB0D59_01070 [Streptomyces sp. NPDC048417]|uniref:hypothetical protein n=1 Tax=Streptomyces sp. NPDC048417 TaxID=3155387 RepID=UPI003412741B
MTGPLTTAQWLTGAGIGLGSSTVLLGLLKLALDGPPLPDYSATRKAPAAPPPSLPARAPQRRPRHAAAPAFADTLPLTRVQPYRARHSKDAA